MLDKNSSVFNKEYSGDYAIEVENYAEPHCLYSVQSSVHNGYLYFNFAVMFLLPTAVSKPVINEYF